MITGTRYVGDNIHVWQPERAAAPRRAQAGSLLVNRNRPAPRRHPAISRWIMGWLLGGACWPALTAPQAEAPAAAQAEVAQAQAAWQQISLTGFTRPRTVLPLATEVAGKVQSVSIDVGEAVPESGRVACLDERFLVLDLRANQAEQGRLRVDITYFLKQVQRHRKLVKQSSSAQAQLDEFERNLGNARQQLRALKVQQAVLEERQQRHCISAPPGWRMLKRQVEPGQWINVGQAVAEIGDFSTLLIPYALSMPEYQALRRQAEDLRVHLPDLNSTVAARIERVAPGFDERSRKINVDLQIGTGVDPRRGGLRAVLTLNIPDPNGAVLLPARALRERYETHWLQRPDNTEVKVMLLSREAGPGQDVQVRVSSPEVKAGDRFLLRHD